MTFIGGLIMILQSQITYYELVTKKEGTIHLIANEEIKIGEITMYPLYELRVQVRFKHAPTPTYIYLYRRTSRSAWLIERNATIEWLSYVSDNFTITVKGKSPAKIYYAICVYKIFLPNIGLFPAGIVAISASILILIENLLYTIHFSKNAMREHFRLKASTTNEVYFTWRDMITVAIIMLLSFFIRYDPHLSVIYNDEIGLGLIKNWGYLGWGYVDTAKQISSLITNKDFRYEAWFAVRNMNKPIIPQIIMALLLLLFPRANPVLMSRVVSIVAAGLTCIIIYILMRRAGFSCIESLFTGVLISLNPINLAYSYAAYPFIVSVFFTALALLALDDWLNTHRKISLYLIGIFVGLSAASISIFCIPVNILLIVITTIVRRKHVSFSSPLVDPLRVFITTSTLSLAVFYISWPSTWYKPTYRVMPRWVKPLRPFLSFLEPTSGAYELARPSPEIVIMGHIVKSALGILPEGLSLVLQTTYVEVIGFLLLFLFLNNLKKSYKSVRIISLSLPWFLSYFLSMAIPDAYKGLRYASLFIVPYTWLASMGWLALAYKIRITKPIKGTRIRFISSIRVQRAALLSLIILQLTMVQSVRPYYALYYNRLLIGMRNPGELFEIPEPTYGLVQVAEYIKEHPVEGRTIITYMAAHTLQFLLPQYDVLYPLFPWKDDLFNLALLMRLGAEYIVYGARNELYAKLKNTTHPLIDTVKKYGIEVLRVMQGDIWLVSLYKISPQKILKISDAYKVDTLQGWLFNAADVNNTPIKPPNVYIDVEVPSIRLECVLPPGGYVYAKYTLDEAIDIRVSPTLLFECWLKFSYAFNGVLTVMFEDINGTSVEKFLSPIISTEWECYTNTYELGIKYITRITIKLINKSNSTQVFTFWIGVGRIIQLSNNS